VEGGRGIVVTLLVFIALAGQMLMSVAAVRRLVSRDSLRDTIATHALLPPLLRGSPLAGVLELGQLAVGIAGVTAVLSGGAASSTLWTASCMAAGGLFVAFTVYLMLLLRTRGRVSCGCLSRHDRVGVASILRAAAFAVATAVAAVTGVPDLSVPSRLLALGVAALITGFAIHLVALADAMAEARMV
jgi:Methylamine utilisation protein MauE